MKTCFRLLLLLLAGWTMTGWAGPVTPDEARQKAQAFLAGNVNGNKRMAPRRTGSATLRQVAQTSAYHVFNVGQAGGFVIVSASDQTQPILGYADEGELDPQNVPHALQLWLDDLQRAVTSVDKGIPQRRTLLPGRKLAKRQTKHAVPVLMTCRWNQGDPYNLQTPSYIETKEDGSTVTHDHSATGCVATAMAQVMYYWKWPKTACKTIPQYSSNWNQQRTLGPLSPVTFKWDDMTDTYGSGSSQKAKDAVAELMKYVGYSIQMGYGPSSGAASVNCGRALRDYYGYAQTTQFVIHDNYTYPEWEDLIYGELALGRPVLMAGDNYERTGGHQWVCDGYDGNGLFHMNWGWGGMSDGFFLLTVMKPDAQGIGGSTASDGYSMGHNIYIGLEPPGRTPPETGDDESGEPAFAITGLSVEKGEYTRAKLTGIFAPKFNIRLKNEVNEAKTYDLGISLYDEEGNLVKNGNNEIFANYKIEMGANASISKDISASFRNVANGTYRMRARCRVNGETVWGSAVDSEAVYAILEVNDYTMKVSTVPKSGLDLQVNDFEMVGKVTYGKQLRIRANITNNGGDYYSDTYLCVDGKRVSGNTIYIPSGATMDIYFTYTPSAGNHTFLLTQNQGKEGVTSGFFKTTINVEETTPTTVIVQQQLLNKTVSENGNSMLYTNEMRIKVTIRNRTDAPYNGNVKSSLWHYGWIPSLREQNITVNLPAHEDTIVYFTYDDLEWNYDYNYHTEADGRNELVSGKYTTKSGGIQYWLNNGTREGAAKVSSFKITSDMAAVYLPIYSVTNPVNMSFDGDINPNLLVYYDEKAIVTSRVKNGYDIKGIKNYVYGNKAENIVIDDSYPFIVGKDFTADNITYTRHLTTDEGVPTAGEATATGDSGLAWNTLVLPFAPQTVTDNNGNVLNWKKSSTDQQLLVKDFTAINGTQLYFSPIENMVPNRPYLIGYNAGQQNLNFSAQDASVEAQPFVSTYSSYYKYLGTYSPVNSNSIYVLSADGKKFEAVADATDVSPFRAYFMANTPEAAQEKNLPIIIEGNATPTGIILDEGLRIKDESNPSAVYDLQGRRVAHSAKDLQPGIYIINGKKIIVK